VRLTTRLYLVLVLRMNAGLDTKNTAPHSLSRVFYTFSPVPIVCSFGNTTRVPPAGSYITHLLSTATVVSVPAEGTVVNCMYGGADKSLARPTSQ